MSVEENSIRVTLLGTGVPSPVMARFGPATLVEAGGEYLVFDAGRGVLQRLFQLQVPLKQVRSLFLTHLHSDHIVGLPDLWLTGWLSGRRELPLCIWGPRGTKAMMENLDRAYDYDIRIRSYDDRLNPEGAVALTEDISAGFVYESNGVKVTTVEVDHSPIYPAFGYRVDYAGRSVFLSGDTRFYEPFIEKVKGVDVIIHEVIDADTIRNSPGYNETRERVIQHHTSEEEAGEVFSRVKPKLAVYTHIIPWNSSPENLIATTRKTYKGPLEVGEDLMVINIGEEVTMQRHNG